MMVIDVTNTIENIVKIFQYAIDIELLYHINI